MSKPALINGKAYDWDSLIILIGGVPVTGISEINYSEEQDIEDNPGAGNLPVSRGFGLINNQGSMKLHMEELEALQNASPTGRIQDIDFFDVVVSWINGAKTTTHTLQACTCMTNGREMSSGDANSEFSVPLKIGKIAWS